MLVISVPTKGRIVRLHPIPLSRAKTVRLPVFANSRVNAREARMLERKESAPLGNLIAQEGCDRCFCGSKYWENDRCIDCNTHVSEVVR